MMPNNALQWDAHGVASLRHGFSRSLRSLGAPERGRYAASNVASHLPDAGGDARGRSARNEKGLRKQAANRRLFEFRDVENQT
jgi:hypothetical protein